MGGGGRRLREPHRRSMSGELQLALCARLPVDCIRRILVFAGCLSTLDTLSKAHASLALSKRLCTRTRDFAEMACISVDALRASTPAQLAQQMDWEGPDGALELLRDTITLFDPFSRAEALRDAATYRARCRHLGAAPHAYVNHHVAVQMRRHTRRPIAHYTLQSGDEAVAPASEARARLIRQREQLFECDAELLRMHRCRRRELEWTSMRGYAFRAFATKAIVRNARLAFVLAY